MNRYRKTTSAIYGGVVASIATFFLGSLESGYAKDEVMNNCTNDENLSFYDVPLVCNAAPEIGCGSRSKPLLLDLEHQSAIKEAWLNRTGTIVAIIWRGPERTEEVAKPVFERHEIEFIERINDHETAESFRKKGGWFHGIEVDRLSLEEAQTIAKTSVDAALKDKLISTEEAEEIKSDIEEYFREELIKLRTHQELIDDSRGKFRQAVVRIYEKHIGKDRTAEARAHGIEHPLNRAPEKTSEAPSCCQ
jgi:hypothetical protein